MNLISILVFLTYVITFGALFLLKRRNKGPVLKLSRAETERFLQLVESPPLPREALKKLMRRYAAKLEDGPKS